jgi:hypothetical protein
MNIKLNWDALGIATSAACAIHCAVLPLLLTTLPIFGINIIDNPLFEYFMIFAAFMVGGWSLNHGFKKHHRRLFPLLLFSGGMLFLIAKQVWHQVHLWLLVPAVLAIISAHFFNFRLCRVFKHTGHENSYH